LFTISRTATATGDLRLSLPPFSDEESVVVVVVARFDPLPTPAVNLFEVLCPPPDDGADGCVTDKSNVLLSRWRTTCSRTA